MRIGLLTLTIACSMTLALGCAGSASDGSASSDVAEQEHIASVSAPLSLLREHVKGDVYHYQFDIPVGSTPNARVRVHRVVREIAPWRPRKTSHAVMLLHGDFAGFVTNFVPTLGEPASSAPGLAPYLVGRGVDAWGVDRRWVLPAADGDISDLGAMGVEQELGDTAIALAFARATRAITDGDGGRIVLGGFSHGGELVYAYAATDGRHVSAIAPIDIYHDLAPEDSAAKDLACANEAFERDALAQGSTDVDNSFFVGLGLLDRSDPAGDSPFFPGTTNRDAMLGFMGQTYAFAPFTPNYHLASPVLDASGTVTRFRETSEQNVSAWLAGAPPHQSMREGAELDGIWCGDTARPDLSRIHVPLYYLGAAGGFGAHGLYTTTRVSSTDVSTHIVHRFGAAREAEDFGHGDLLYANDAEALAWRGLATWLLQR